MITAIFRVVIRINQPDILYGLYKYMYVYVALFESSFFFISLSHYSVILTQFYWRYDIVLP